MSERSAISGKPSRDQMISLVGPRRRQSESAVPDLWRPIIAELNEYVAAGAGKNKQAVLCMGFNRTATGIILCRRNAERGQELCREHSK